MYMLWGSQNDGAKAASRPRQGRAKAASRPRQGRAKAAQKCYTEKTDYRRPKKPPLGTSWALLGTDFGAQEMSGEQKCQNLKI